MSMFQISAVMSLICTFPQIIASGASMLLRALLTAETIFENVFQVAYTV